MSRPNLRASGYPTGPEHTRRTAVSTQWVAAALAVGIGFGLQEIVANFVSGLIIPFVPPIRVGDTITVGGTDGVVTKIRIRAISIHNWDRKELLLPNKELIPGRLLTDRSFRRRICDKARKYLWTSSISRKRLLD